MKTTTLPPYVLAIFEETAEEKAAREERERQTNADAEAERQRQAAAETERQRQADADKEKQRQADADKEKQRLADEEKEKERIRNERGQFESAEDYKRRIGELNEENKTRRQENRDLKTTLTVLERRTVMADLREVVAKSDPLTERLGSAAMDQFLKEHGDDVKIDPKTGDTVGLDKFAAWKKANPDFFKPEETEEQKTARLAAEKKAADDAATAARRGNRSSNGGSPGGGSSGGKDTSGIPDLRTLKTPAEREAAIRAHARSLSGGGSGYARASSAKE